MKNQTLGGVTAIHYGTGAGGSTPAVPPQEGRRGASSAPYLVIHSNNPTTTRTQDAVRWTIEELWEDGKGKVFMWTFTMPMPIPAMWFPRTWDTFIKRAYRGIAKWNGLRVFEWHREHGLHCHMITSRRLPIAMIKRYWESVGGGRIHVCRVWTQQDALYVAKYIGKDHGKMLSGMRQWARLGGCGVKVKQVKRECPEQRFIYKELAAFKNPTKRDRYYAMNEGVKKYHKEVTAWRGVEPDPF